MELKDKVVAITGGANGIGRATAFAFGDRGAQIFLTDIDEVALDKTRAELEERGSAVETMIVDVTSEKEVVSMVDRAIGAMGDLDVLVNNAGVTVSGPAETVPLEDWRWIVDINMWPHVYAIRAALPYFRKKGSGHLVHVSSAAGILGTPGFSAYSMTKFAVYGLAESVAVTLQDTDIGVSVVCPLWVNTDIGERGRLTIDPDLGLDPDSVRTLGREFLRTTGIPPEKVGEAIVSGVEEGKFLILPHPEVLQFAQIKWSDPERYIERAANALTTQRRFFGEQGEPEASS
jgi:NAD(P)-dependent dehydrogenase (short-subunit alcohol dehydrogenase family)